MRWQAATGSDPVRERGRNWQEEGRTTERERESDISAYLQRREGQRHDNESHTNGGQRGSTNAHAGKDYAERASIGLLDHTGVESWSCLFPSTGLSLL